jgi:hypothetical protein
MASLSILGRCREVFRALLLTAIAVTGASRPAWAVVPSPTGFTLDISPNSRVLDALDAKNDGLISASQYYDIKYDESCDNPHLRIHARNKPAIMITNDANSAAPITSFTLQINEGPYVFGTGDIASDNFSGFIKNTMYTDAGVNIIGNSVSADQKLLTVNFEGLGAGKMAIFHIDLDTTDANSFVYPDYRMVLFGAPLEGESPTDPATSAATFTNSTAAPNSKTLTIGFTQETDTPQFANENIRSYSQMDKMEVIHLRIPEPNAAVLVLAGLATLAVRARRSR